jgi:hypothetical protein
MGSAPDSIVVDCLQTILKIHKERLDSPLGSILRHPLFPSTVFFVENIRELRSQGA